MASTASLLLRLLKLSSAERVEVMLQPHILLQLWVESGRTKDEMEARLRSKVKPGELLLELFDARGADALWASLPPRVQSRADEPPERLRLTRLAREDEPSRAERYLGFGGLVAVVVAAMFITGSFPELGRGFTLGRALTGVLGGMLCGGMFALPRTAGILGGLLGGCTVVGVATLAERTFPPGRLVSIGSAAAGVLVGILVTLLLQHLLSSRQPPKTF